MQLSRRRALPFVFLAALAAGLAACGDSNTDSASSTATIEYTGTIAYPTVPPGGEIEPPENLPAPTFQGEPTVTASGLEVHEITVGTQGEPAQPGDIVYVKYTLWVQGGNQVDRTQSGSVRTRLTEGQTIDGLIEGLTGMQIGGRRILVIPPQLAYGDQGTGNVIPPGATIIYDIERTAGP